MKAAPPLELAPRHNEPEQRKGAHEQRELRDVGVGYEAPKCRSPGRPPRKTTGEMRPSSLV